MDWPWLGDGKFQWFTVDVCPKEPSDPEYSRLFWSFLPICLYPLLGSCSGMSDKYFGVENRKEVVRPMEVNHVFPCRLWDVSKNITVALKPKNMRATRWLKPGSPRTVHALFGYIVLALMLLQAATCGGIVSWFSCQGKNLQESPHCALVIDLKQADEVHHQCKSKKQQTSWLRNSAVSEVLVFFSDPSNLNWAKTSLELDMEKTRPRWPSIPLAERCESYAWIMILPILGLFSQVHRWLWSFPEVGLNSS